MKSRRRCSGISQTSAAWLWPPPAIRTTTIFIVSAPGVERSVISVGSTKLDGKAQRIAAHSARGPSSPHSLLKPEIVAPGELIQSAKMGTGSDGAWFTGSSLATPHVSGAAALARQAHPGRTATQIKSLLLNTANPIAHKDGTPYPESLAGAGFLDVAQAVKTTVTAMAEGTDGLTTLSLGDLAFSTPWKSTRQIRVTNHGKAAVSFELSVEETVTEPGFTIELPEEKTIQVPANDHRLVTVTFKANPKQFDRSGDPLTPEKINRLRPELGVRGQRKNPARRRRSDTACALSRPCPGGFEKSGRLSARLVCRRKTRSSFASCGGILPIPNRWCRFLSWPRSVHPKRWP